MQLIDKTAAYKALKHEAETHCLSFSVEAYDKSARIIDQIPTIEAEPVRHGRWIRNAMGEGYHCSNCGHHVDSPIGEMIDPRDYKYFLDKYCGGCGARMDGGADNG